MIRISDKIDCCGCTACVQTCPQKCIAFYTDEHGFQYPRVDESSCIECGVCENVCPVLNSFEPLPLKPESYACVSKDESIVEQSASGGLFTILSTEVINNGGIVFGACFQEDWSVAHEYTDTIEGLARFRGSKYVQSSLGNTFTLAKQFLKDGKQVLFSGTPCQVAGLNHFLRKQYDNLITVDFVCHSVPSPMVWQMYLKSVSKGRVVTNVTFRDKSLGWERFGLVVKGEDYSGKENVFVQGDHHLNSYMRGFLEDLFVRPCCQRCPARNYTSGSDLTIADCWGFNKYHPDKATQKGMSLALLNTAKGKELYRTIELNLHSMAIPYNEVEETKLHSPLTRSTPPHPERRFFYSNLRQDNIEPLLEKCLARLDRKKKKRKLFLKIIHSMPGFYLFKSIRDKLLKRKK